mgnify:CR=1 FL=1|tara:strand:+ start:388 stop:582 length:195 start_codon:yes stop_codon:yes gene_type:complete
MKKCCENTLSEFDIKREEATRVMSAQMGNLEVQIADYQQIVKELSDKLKLYEKKYGVVFKSSTR